MRILVTGGAGFIGSHVTEAYLAAGHEVEVLDDLSTGSAGNVPAGVKLNRCSLLEADARQVFERFRPEVVSHHAAQASVKVSTTDVVRDLTMNGGATARVGDLCLSVGVSKLIYSSTGGALYGDPERLPVDETHPIRPLSNYGVSKRVGELYLDLLARTRGLRTTVLRYANAYGPRQDPRGEAGVIAIFTGRMLAGEACTIDGDGEQQKDYLYVGDIARANVLALEAGDGVALNLGTGEGTSVNTIFRELARATGYGFEPVHGPARPGDVRNIWLDSSLAAKTLGWRAEVSIGEGLRRTVAWYRESGRAG